MDEVKTNKVENLPVLEEVPEGATLIAEVDGEFYRVKGERSGGGSLHDLSDVLVVSSIRTAEGETHTANMSYANLQGLMTRNALAAAYYNEWDCDPPVGNFECMQWKGTTVICDPEAYEGGVVCCFKLVGNSANVRWVVVHSDDSVTVSETSPF